MVNMDRVMRVREIVNEFIHKYGRLPTETDPDYLEMLRMTKYNVIDFPSFKPSQCINCGSCKTDDRKYVDIGRDIEWYGLVYFCTHCLKDIARVAGLFDEYANELVAAQTEINELQNKLSQGVLLPDKLVQAWEEFKEYYASIQPAGNNSEPDIILSTDGVPPVQESNETESDKSGINTAKPRTTKSTSSSRRKDVPSLAELLSDSGN